MKINLLKWSIFLPLYCIISMSGVKSQDVKRKAVADCFVKKGSGPQVQDYLLLKYTNATDRRPYLRFDISNVDTARIKSVHVAMYMSTAFTSPNKMALKLYKVSDNTWSETAQSWPGPAYDPSSCADFTIDSIFGCKKSADITSYFKERYKETDKLLSLAIFSEQIHNSTVTFSSKETAGENAPVLQIYYKPTDTIRVYDTIPVYDTTHVVINDTIWHNDTIPVYDTTYFTKYDTTRVTVHDTIDVYDTTHVVINDTIWHTVKDTVRYTITDTSNVLVYDTLKVAVEDTLNIKFSVTGINQADNNTEILVYPNPVRDKVNIRCKEFAYLTGYNIKLVDMLSSSRWSRLVTSENITIDLKGFPAGIYFLEIYNDKGKKISTRKIVLQ